MRAVYRMASLTMFAVLIGATAADAIPINVAEFRWDTILEPGEPCPNTDPLCIPTDPTVRSVFSLTNIWDGPGPGASLFNNLLLLPSGNSLFFDLAFPLQFDQLVEFGVPAFAATSVSFFFGGEVISLAATLTEPDTFAVLQFNSVPEPGTLGLVLLGTAVFARYTRRARRRM